MTEVSPLPLIQQLFDDNGQVLSAGKVFTYQISTLVPLQTFSDISGTVSNSNPVIADSSGRVSIWAPGDVRCIVKDSNDVLIRDFNTTAPLRADVVSTPLLPVVGAPTTAIARTLLGVDQAIAAAIATVAGITGPTGSSGTGITGPTGPTGPSGSGYQPTATNSNPGYIQFSSINGTAANAYLQAGTAVTDGSGNGSVSFPKPYATTCFAVVANSNDGATGSWWVSTFSVSNTGFSVKTSSPLHSGGWPGAIGYNWFAIGW